jgi:hypothetical protein
VTPADPGTEITGESAAALAAAYVVFKTRDSLYSTQLLQKARDIYALARGNRNSYTYSQDAGLRDAGKNYPSYNYADELAWAAAWLYRATNEANFLQDAKDFYQQVYNPYWGGWAYSYDEKNSALHVLMSRIDSTNWNSKYHIAAVNYLTRWLPGRNRTVPHTPKGFAYRLERSSTAYAGNTAFLCLSYAKFLNEIDKEKDLADRLVSYAKTQIGYILGDQGQSYLGGYGSKTFKNTFFLPTYNNILTFPLKTASTAAQMEDFFYGGKQDRFIPYGALVSGPVRVNKLPTDIAVDTRADFTYTGTSLESGIGFMGAVARMVELYGGDAVSDCTLELGWNQAPSSSIPAWKQNC